MTFQQLAQRIRVPAGFVLAPLLFIAARPSPGSLLTGGAIAVIGLAIRAWASGYIKKNEELTVTGPYAHTRNPLYLGTFLLGTGIAISAGTLWFTGLFMAFYLFIYLPVMFAEAETMRTLFPSEYEDYSKRVPLFHMRFTPYRRTASRQPHAASEWGSGRFDSSLYLRHREYRAAFGLLGVYALLAAKLVLLPPG
ncbi:MAG TPA: isoprenylcysteine carboxylmethyltransferase family protein [Blastocatellia bacterium]|nr:isoprenylcysteine carboxylmethyltransferase family protein [Blastocatellia bacterium]